MPQPVQAYVDALRSSFRFPDTPKGNDPIVVDYGSTPVRLPDGEVVWGERIDPRARYSQKYPSPESGYRWGDVVLHDGAPNGERESNGYRYPVFDLLERWSPSEIPTLTVDVEYPTEADSDALIDLFDTNHTSRQRIGPQILGSCARLVVEDCLTATTIRLERMRRHVHSELRVLSD